MTTKELRLIASLGLGTIIRMSKKQVAAGVYFTMSLLAVGSAENCEIDYVFLILLNLVVSTIVLNKANK